MAEKEKTATSFDILNSISLKDKTKEKIGLTYLSWAYAWGEIMKRYPDAVYTIFTREVTSTTTTKNIADGYESVTVEETTNEVPYFTDGKTCYVKVGLTIDNRQYIEYLPVMDNKQNAIRAEVVTSTAVNKALQRAFVKVCARHGLGLYIYAGEDLPEEEKVKMAIDFDGIATAADNYNCQTLSEADFEKLKEHVIQIIAGGQKDKSASNAIVAYVTKLFPGKKLSMTTFTEDCANMQKVSYFLGEIEAALNGRNSNN